VPEPVAAAAPEAAVDVVLRDGSTVHVRPAAPHDLESMHSFLAGLSPESRRLRYFSGGVNLEWAADAAVTAARPASYGVVATRGGDGRIVAHASYVGARQGRAEVAFEVADEIHGMGIATTLLAHLAEAAVADGIDWFDAQVLPENHAMIEVFRESGFDVRTRSLAGVIEVQFPTELSPEGRRRFDERERVAAAAAVRSFLVPASVAVIGASRRSGTVGNQVLRNLVEHRFEGPVYAINPRADHVASLPAYDSIEDVPHPVELAVVAVAADAALEAARGCARKGVRALLVLSAGFAESGPAGAERQRDLVEICRAAGMRLIGPNCLGLLNTAEAVSLDATFAPEFPPRGSIGFLSQSGALGLAIMDRAGPLGLGLSSFVSNGNKADISGNDLLEYWEEDPATQVIVLYLESFGNPRKFARIARRVGERKPILAVKSGRSAAGSKATGSHTGRIVSASELTVDALFRQAGVIRTDTLSELFDVARLIAAQPIPCGRRVAIVTNGGGLGILCADACDAAGLEVVELPQAVRTELASFLPAAAATTNPVDMIATASSDDYRRTVAAIAAADCVDSVIAIFVPPLATRSDDVARAVAEAAATADPELTVLTVFASDEPARDALVHDALRLPAYAYPEEAARALGKAAAHGVWRASPPGGVPAFDGLRGDEAAALIASALEREPGWLEPDEVQRLLSCYGIATPRSALVATPAAAVAAASGIGGPVAVKAVAPTLLHKTDAGAVALGLLGDTAVAAGAESVRSAAAAAGAEPVGYLVQAMAPAGVEMIVGVVEDPLFGPVVACGSGGTTAELARDVAVRLTPVTDVDAREMVRSLRMYPLLDGYRGAPRADVGALEEVVLRLAALIERHGEVVEVDLNPVIVSPDGATVVDARVRVDHAPPPKPWPAVGA
jgi:acetyl coenzyme A synthetase (ADP forming)-like protein